MRFDQMLGGWHAPGALILVTIVASEMLNCALAPAVATAQPPTRPRRAPWEIDPFVTEVYVDDEELTAEVEAVSNAGEVLPTLQKNAARRTPGSVLGAMVTRKTGELPPPAEDEPPYLAALRLDALAGDWASAKQRIAALPEESRPVAYGQLLALLAGGSLVQPSEIDAIADAASGELTPEQIVQLGSLLQQATDESKAPKEFLAALNRGTSRFGGDDGAKRLAAARLLLAAGMLDDALTFLPTLATALEQESAEMLNVHARVEHARFVQGDAGAAERAWKILLAALRDEKAAAPVRDETIGRMVLLLDKLPRETAAAWLREQFREQPDRALLLMAIAAQQAETAYAASDQPARVAILAAIQLLADALLDEREKDVGPWREPLRILALVWLNEALKGSGESKRILLVEDDDEIGALEPQVLLAGRPSERWLAALPSDTAALAHRLAAQFAAASGDWETTRRLSSAVDDDAARQRIVDSFLDAWAAKAALGSGELERVLEEYRQQGYSAQQIAVMRPQILQELMANNSGEGTALTRASQVLQLEKFGELLTEIKRTDLPLPSAAKQADVFAGCHSPAEVYRTEDIEQVFGPLDHLPPELAINLVQSMRGNLAQQWRNLKMQELAGTNRTDQEVVREIRRGYDLALEIVAKFVARKPSHVAAHLLAAQLTFDKAEFMYGIGVDLEKYTATRDEAFAAFAKAAEVYAATLPKLKPEEYSVDVHLNWFQASLGASDLSYLTRQDSADATQIERIGAAIRALGPPWVDAHLTLFGAGLEENIASIPPQLKPICLQQALVVLDDHAAGQAARKLLKYYEELLAELELHLDIDGRDAVGHGQPFGARLSLRYSQPLGREGDGFTSLLETTYDPNTGDPLDNKEKVSQEIREKLDPGFEVREIRFHDPNVQPRSFGRRGWRETPLAYVVLAAKDPSIDTVPPLQIDLPFRDTHGSVLLPIVSRPVLIDAREANTAPRPCEITGVKQLLDDREWPGGDLRLEITAAGRGLLSPLEKLFDLREGAEHGGLHVAAIEDRGTVINALEATADGIRPQCERTWLVSFQPIDRSAVQTPTRFEFPVALDKQLPQTRERYADADVVACDAIVSLPVSGGQTLAKFAWPAALGTLTLVGIGAIALAVRHSWRQPAAPPAYVRPAQLTPFSVIALLNRMRSDERLRLSASDRGALQAAIADLEDEYFARDDAPAEPRQLEAVLNRWWPRTRGIAAAN